MVEENGMLKSYPLMIGVLFWLVFVHMVNIMMVDHLSQSRYFVWNRVLVVDCFILLLYTTVKLVMNK